MSSYWSPTQPNAKQEQRSAQQSFNPGFFQSQQHFPYMQQQQQQQQQQQGQFMFQNFPPFPPFPPFPSFANTGVQNTHNSPPNHYYPVAGNSNSSERYSSPESFHFEREAGNNRMSYERNGNQEQYASYPRDAVYRHASGPGWQRQEVSYPPTSFK